MGLIQRLSNYANIFMWFFGIVTVALIILMIYLVVDSFSPWLFFILIGIFITAGITWRLWRINEKNEQINEQITDMMYVPTYPYETNQPYV
jgi:uncharacterized membrane protein